MASPPPAAASPPSGMRPSHCRSFFVTPSSGCSLSNGSKSFGMPSSSVSSSPCSRCGRSAPSGPNSGSVPPATVAAATDSSVSFSVSSLAMLSKRVMSSSTSSSSSYMRRTVRSRSATTSQRRSRTMICDPTAVIDLGRSGRSSWSTSSNSAVRSSPSIFPGIVRPRNDSSVGATSWVEAYQSTSSPDFCAVRVADQVRDLVGDPVRGRRRPADVAVLAEREAVVAEDEHRACRPAPRPSACRARRRPPPRGPRTPRARGRCPCRENSSSTIRPSVGPRPSSSARPGRT